MELSFLVRGMLLGFAIAAPVGPIGVLCIRRTLAEGRLVGFVSGLGAATADLLYGCVAAFGLTMVTGALTNNSFWLRLIGGAFMLYLGGQTFRSVPAERPAEATSSGLLGAYGSTLLLTITNPTTIFSFLAMFAAVGAGNTGGDYGAALLVAAGVFGGSAFWWLLLSGGVSLLRNHFTPTRMRLVNRAAGIVIVGFGVLALASLLTS